MLKKMMILYLVLNSCSSSTNDLEADTQAGLDKHQILAVIRHRLSGIMKCYRDIKPEGEGTMLIYWEIEGKTGKVLRDSLYFKQADIYNPAFKNCLLEDISQWIFPIPHQEVLVRVRFPFDFQPKK